MKNERDVDVVVREELLQGQATVRPNAVCMLSRADKPMLADVGAWPPLTGSTGRYKVFVIVMCEEWCQNYASRLPLNR